MIYQKLDEQTLQAVLDILETMGEALAHYRFGRMRRSGKQCKTDGWRSRPP